MERELWLTMYRWLIEHAKTVARTKGVWYGDASIAAVWLWAVLHERATSWAADARNWPRDLLLSFELPSQSTLSRRLRSERFGAFLAGVHESLLDRANARGALVKVMDAKPLPVGAYSRAKDARWGRGARAGCSAGTSCTCCTAPGRCPSPGKWRR